MKCEICKEECKCKKWIPQVGDVYKTAFTRKVIYIHEEDVFYIFTREEDYEGVEILDIQAEELRERYCIERDGKRYKKKRVLEADCWYAVTLDKKEKKAMQYKESRETKHIFYDKYKEDQELHYLSFDFVEIGEKLPDSLWNVPE